jgi:2-phospho-L-lactate guanylyltransferase
MPPKRPCIALVPARDFEKGKSRLAGSLSDEKRAALGEWMLGRVLEAVSTSGGVDEIGVLSDGGPVLSLAESKGAEAIPCPGHDLNADLGAGLSWALERGARSLLIVPGDLPALKSSDVNAMIAQAAVDDCAVLSPSADGGTNGVFLCPPDGFSFSFGPGSFGRHLEAAKAAQLHPIRFENEGFGLDVDTPADLSVLAEAGVALPDWLAALPRP